MSDLLPSKRRKRYISANFLEADFTNGVTDIAVRSLKYRTNVQVYLFLRRPPLPHTFGSESTLFLLANPCS